jgi:hypothetical protein
LHSPVCILPVIVPARIVVRIKPIFRQYCAILIASVVNLDPDPELFDQVGAGIISGSRSRYFLGFKIAFNMLDHDGNEKIDKVSSRVQ